MSFGFVRLLLWCDAEGRTSLLDTSTEEISRAINEEAKSIGIGRSSVLQQTIDFPKKCGLWVWEGKPIQDSLLSEVLNFKCGIWRRPTDDEAANLKRGVPTFTPTTSSLSVGSQKEEIDRMKKIMEEDLRISAEHFVFEEPRSGLAEVFRPMPIDVLKRRMQRQSTKKDLRRGIIEKALYENIPNVFLYHPVVTGDTISFRADAPAPITDEQDAEVRECLKDIEHQTYLDRNTYSVCIPKELPEKSRKSGEVPVGESDPNIENNANITTVRNVLREFFPMAVISVVEFGDYHVTAEGLGAALTKETFDKFVESLDSPWMQVSALFNSGTISITFPSEVPGVVGAVARLTQVFWDHVSKDRPIAWKGDRTIISLSSRPDDQFALDEIIVTEKKFGVIAIYRPLTGGQAEIIVSSPKKEEQSKEARELDKEMTERLPVPDKACAKIAGMLEAVDHLTEVLWDFCDKAKPVQWEDDRATFFLSSRPDDDFALAETIVTEEQFSVVCVYRPSQDGTAEIVVSPPKEKADHTLPDLDRNVGNTTKCAWSDVPTPEVVEEAVRRLLPDATTFRDENEEAISILVKNPTLIVGETRNKLVSFLSGAARLTFKGDSVLITIRKG